MTDLVRYSWALHSTLYASDDPAAERGHIEAETPTVARNALHSSFAGRDGWITIWHPDGACVSSSRIAAGGGR